MCTERYIDPFTDFGFKRMFGSEQSKAYLVNFLNALLKEPDPIVDIQYKNTEQLGLLPGDRNAIYDLYCTTDKGGHVIVEMQNSSQRYFIDRAIYYSTFPIQQEAEPGKWDYRLPKVYMVSFLNFTLSDYVDGADYKHEVKLVDLVTKRVFYDKLTYIFLEMPKFIKELDELEGGDDYWLYIIKNLQNLPEIPERMDNELFRSFFELAEVSRLSKDDYAAYELSLKRMRDNYNVVNYAMEKGRAEGIEKGIEKRNIEIAKEMVSKGIAIEVIAEITGLPTEEILLL
ncbi:MAG: Rpn family recombination-promoting nuclease/putative transposase [Bacteroidales bacterium]|nr:Rpn family recombination-promoting nuclease/putative transposase [Bacteroidales bacterium]